MNARARSRGKARRPSLLLSLLLVAFSAGAVFLSFADYSNASTSTWRPPTDEQVKEWLSTLERSYGVSFIEIDKFYEDVSYFGYTLKQDSPAHYLAVAYYAHEAIQEYWDGDRVIASYGYALGEWRVFADGPAVLNEDLRGYTYNYDPVKLNWDLLERLKQKHGNVYSALDMIPIMRSELFGGDGLAYYQPGWPTLTLEDGGSVQDKGPAPPGVGEDTSATPSPPGSKIPGPGSWWEWLTGTVVAGAIAAGAGLVSSIFGGAGLVPPQAPPAGSGIASDATQGAVGAVTTPPELTQAQGVGPDIIDRTADALDPWQSWAEWSKDGYGAFTDFTANAIIPAINAKRKILFEGLNMKDPLEHAYWSSRGVNVSKVKMNEFSKGIGNAMWYFDVINDTFKNVAKGDSYIDAALKSGAGNYLTYGISKTAASPTVSIYEALNKVLLGGSKAGEIASHTNTLKEGANFLYDKIKDSVFGTDEATTRLDSGHYGDNLKNLHHATEIGSEWVCNEGQMMEDLTDVVTNDDFYRDMYETNRELWKPAEGSWAPKRAALYIGEKSMEMPIKIAETTKNIAQRFGETYDEAYRMFSRWF